MPNKNNIDVENSDEVIQYAKDIEKDKDKKSVDR